MFLTLKIIKEKHIRDNIIFLLLKILSFMPINLDNTSIKKIIIKPDPNLSWGRTRNHDRMLIIEEINNRVLKSLNFSTIVFFDKLIE